MTNHVHLLASAIDAAGISRVMQSVGRRYVRYFNARHHRTGTLWEGRFRASMVDSEQYLFSCLRYIEENPVRAGMVRDVSEYQWSSYGFNALGRDDPLVTPHDRYLALDRSAAGRRSAYQALFRQPNDPSVFAAIRDATNRCLVLGTDGVRSRTLTPGSDPGI